MKRMNSEMFGAPLVDLLPPEFNADIISSFFKDRVPGSPNASTGGDRAHAEGAPSDAQANVCRHAEVTETVDFQRNVAHVPEDVTLPIAPKLPLMIDPPAILLHLN